MSRLLLLLLSISLVFGGHILQHKCHHDKIYDELRTEPVEQTLDEEYERHLQTATPRKMIISYDMTYFNSLNLTDPTLKSFRDNCEKAVKIAVKFFNDLITIVPKPAGQMKWTLTTTTCGKVTIPAADKTTDKPSDLHLYVSYTNEPTQSYLAYAGWCRFVKTLGPTHGQVNFNLGLLKNYSFTNPIVFADLLEIVFHEITHVLGFSGYDIPNWVTAAKVPHVKPTVVQVIRGLNVTMVTTPNILAQARSYYNCTTLAGMPLENQGSAGSKGSHWETNAINNELMNAAISSTQGVFTKFTTALLRDTGFYATVNAALEEASFWGKNKGCSFITGACSTANRETCTAGASNICDYYHYGVSTCASGTFTEGTCPVTQAYGNGKCYDGTGHFLNSATYIQKLGVAFGTQSRCFQSSLSDPSIIINPQGVCYNFSCNVSKQVIVTVGTKTITCTKNGEVLALAGWKGTLKCPDNLADFCAYKGFCPNHCSTNGYCNKNVCKCITGYSGADCKTKV